VAQSGIVPCGLCLRMLFLVFLALLVAIQVALTFGKFFAFKRVVLVLAGVFGITGTAGGGLLTNLEGSTLLRLVTLDETAQADLQKRPVAAALGLSAAAYRAKFISINVHKAELDELREQIKYELRLGNITAKKATTLSALIDEISLEGNIGDVNAPNSQALADLMRSQDRLNETLADTIKLVTILDSVRRPEFAGTFIAAKIQVVRLLAEKAAIDGSIDDIRENMKRPKAG
jgi:hypothetical protein